MKKSYKIIVAFVFAALVMSCEKDPIIFGGSELILFESSSTNVTESAGDITITIISDVSGISSPLTIGGTAVEGEDYTIDADASVSVGDEKSIDITISLIDNLEADGVKTIELTLDNGGLSENTDEGKVHTVTIADDDCPYPLVDGSYNVVTTGTSPAGCDGVTNSVTVTFVSDNGDGTMTFELSDVTGGLYKNCYGSADNPGEIVVEGYDVTLTAQPDVVYGGDQFDGTGSIDACESTMTLSWSNGFGDAGTTVFSL